MFARRTERSKEERRRKTTTGIKYSQPRPERSLNCDQTRSRIPTAGGPTEPNLRSLPSLSLSLFRESLLLLHSPTLLRTTVARWLLFLFRSNRTVLLRSFVLSETLFFSLSLPSLLGRREHRHKGRGSCWWLLLFVSPGARPRLFVCSSQPATPPPSKQATTVSRLLFILLQ